MGRATCERLAASVEALAAAPPPKRTTSLPQLAQLPSVAERSDAVLTVPVPLTVCLDSQCGQNCERSPAAVAAPGVWAGGARGGVVVQGGAGGQSGRRARRARARSPGRRAAAAGEGERSIAAPARE